MKFIWRWEWEFKDIQLETELSDKFQKALKENPTAFPKLGPTCFTGRGKGFRLIEADNEEQLMNLVNFWTPTEKWCLEPYFESPPFTANWRKWMDWQKK